MVMSKQTSFRAGQKQVPLVRKTRPDVSKKSSSLRIQGDKTSTDEVFADPRGHPEIGIPQAIEKFISRRLIVRRKRKG